MRLAVLASGGGSNLQAILDAIASRTLDATVALVMTDRSEAGALNRAASAGIPTSVIPPRNYPTTSAFASAMLTALTAHEVDFVALAGYMHYIPPSVVRNYQNRMLNVHPSLLPAFGGAGFYGMRVHRAALAYGVRWSGATVHLVDDQFDNGPIVLQEPVRVEPDDTPETLAARVLTVEHRLFPEALRLFAQDRVQIDKRQVTIRPA